MLYGFNDEPANWTAGNTAIADATGANCCRVIVPWNNFSAAAIAAVDEVESAGMTAIVCLWSNVMLNPVDYANQFAAAETLWPDAILCSYNEPNISFFGSLSPAQAATLTNAAANAVSGLIIGPAVGWGGGMLDYLDQMYNLITEPLLGVGLHMYPDNGGTWETQIDDGIDRAAAHGDVYVTEFAFPYVLWGPYQPTLSAYTFAKLEADARVEALIFHRLAPQPDFNPAEAAGWYDIVTNTQLRTALTGAFAAPDPDPPPPPDPQPPYAPPIDDSYEVIRRYGGIFGQIHTEMKHPLWKGRRRRGLVMLGGWQSTADHWASPGLESLGQLKVIIGQRPGRRLRYLIPAGCCGTLDDWGNGVMDQRINDLIDYLQRTQFFPSGRVDFFGISGGSHAALTYSLHFPERVGTIVCELPAVNLQDIHDTDYLGIGIQASIEAAHGSATVPDERNPITVAEQYIEQDILLIHSENDVICKVEYVREFAERANCETFNMGVVNTGGFFPGHSVATLDYNRVPDFLDDHLR